MADVPGSDALSLAKILDWAITGFGFVLGYLYFSIRVSIADMKTDHKAELNRQKVEFNDKLDKFDASFSKHKDRVYERIDKQEAKVLEAISELAKDLTPMSHCEAKQTLWEERLLSQREADTKDHENIRETIRLGNESLTLAVRQMSDEMNQVRSCLQKLQQKKEC